MATDLSSQNFRWQQTMLRIKNPEKSLAFYRDLMGMTLIDKIKFPDMNFDLYFLATVPEAEPYTLEPGTDAAHKFLWTTDLTTLELTHNYGTESDEGFSYHPGNQEKDGFGHIAFNCTDVYAATEKLENAGIAFKKKPDEGRMKGLAFAYDPDGYWVELVKRGDAPISNYFNLSQTMLRVKDAKKTIEFYTKLGLKCVREYHGGDFSLYFMAHLPAGVSPPADLSSAEASTFVKNLFGPVLELTHNHGTENDETFKHFTGNEDGRKGFGHIGFLVDDVEKACAGLEAIGATFKKRSEAGTMKGLAFAQDPDGYWVEIIKRGGYDEKGTPFWLEK